MIKKIFLGFLFLFNLSINNSYADFIYFQDGNIIKSYNTDTNDIDTIYESSFGFSYFQFYEGKIYLTSSDSYLVDYSWYGYKLYSFDINTNTLSELFYVSSINGNTFYIYNGDIYYQRPNGLYSYNIFNYNVIQINNTFNENIFVNSLGIFVKNWGDGKIYRRDFGSGIDNGVLYSNILFTNFFITSNGDIYGRINSNYFIFFDFSNESINYLLGDQYNTYFSVTGNDQKIYYSNYIFQTSDNSFINNNYFNSYIIFYLENTISSNCYDVNIGKGFTGTIVSEDLFSSLEINDYNIEFGSGTKNTFLISSIPGTEKFSYTFKENGGKEVEYYNDGELCTDNACIKESLFGGDFGDYIYSPNANFFSNNINTKFYVNTNFDNVIGFALSSVNENFTYSLYGRPDGETSYKYLGAFKSYTWNNIGGTTFEQKGELKYYSDFYVIIPRQYIGFGRYIHHVTLWYGGEYGDLYKTVCEYDDGSYTINGDPATQEEVQSVIKEGENKGNNVFNTGSTISDSDITQDIWNIDADGDGEISTWEQLTAPYTIAKNLVNKFIDSLKNIWNLLKSIQNIGNISFIDKSYADQSLIGILDPLSEKTKSMLNGTNQRDGFNNFFNIIQWGLFAIALLTIIITFLILKIKK